MTPEDWHIEAAVREPLGPRTHYSVEVAKSADRAPCEIVGGPTDRHNLGIEMNARVEIARSIGAGCKLLCALFKIAEAHNGGGLVVHRFSSCLHPGVIARGVINFTTTRPLFVKTMRAPVQAGRAQGSYFAASLPVRFNHLRRDHVIGLSAPILLPKLMGQRDKNSAMPFKYFNRSRAARFGWQIGCAANCFVTRQKLETLATAFATKSNTSATSNPIAVAIDKDKIGTIHG